MKEDPIIGQIEGLGNRRLIISAAIWLLALLLGGIVLGLAANTTNDKATIIAIACAVSGLLLGFATSILTSSMRRLLKIVFISLGIFIAILLFASRTIGGYSSVIPLRLVATPLAFPIAFCIGQSKLRKPAST